MPDLLRFGLIGCGAQGRYLSEALAMTRRAHLTACADISDEAAQKAVRFCGYAKAYSDYAQMLDAEQLDAVIVATTHDQLSTCALAALQAGKHALVEKPMALTVDDAKGLVDAARSARVRLMPGYTLRFMPERILMKKMLDEGAVGRLAHIGGGQLIGGMGGWLSDPLRGGGPVFYVGSHVIDHLLWLAGGGPTRVYAEIDWTQEDGVEAGVDATLRFPGGVTGHVCTSQKLGGRYGWVDVMGTGGRMRAEWESHDLLIQSTSRPEYTNLTRIQVPDDAYMPQVDPEAQARVSGFKYVRNWMAEISELIDAIEQDREPSATGADGVRALQVMQAIFDSARTGAPVDIEPY